MRRDLAAALVLGVGAHRVVAGTITAGTLLAFVLYLDSFFTPIQQLSQVFDGYQQAVGRACAGSADCCPPRHPPRGRRPGPGARRFRRRAGRPGRLPLPRTDAGAAPPSTT